MRPVRTRAPERNGGEDLRKGKERAEGPRRKELLQKGTSRATINLQLEEHGKRQCHLIFRRGIQAEQQSLKGRSLVLYMLSGPRQQPLTRDEDLSVFLISTIAHQRRKGSREQRELGVEEQATSPLPNLCSKDLGAEG